MIEVFHQYFCDVRNHLCLRKDSLRRFTPEAKGEVLSAYLGIARDVASTAFVFLLL